VIGQIKAWRQPPNAAAACRKETAALIYLKTAAWLCVQLFGRKRPSATTAVFFIPTGQYRFAYNRYQVILFTIFTPPQRLSAPT